MHAIQQTDCFLCEVQDKAEETVQHLVYVVRYLNQGAVAINEVNISLVAMETKRLSSFS